MATPDQTCPHESDAESPPHPEAIPLTAHIESIATLTIHALNSDTISSTSSIWSHLSDDFATSGFGYEALTREEFATNHENYVSLWPDHYIQLTDLTTTLNSRFTTAKTFANMEISGGHGVPVGMSRKVVSVFDFKKWEGRWLLVSVRSMPGDDGGGMESETEKCEHPGEQKFCCEGCRRGVEHRHD